MKKFQSYKCEKCGLEVEVQNVGSGNSPICCGAPMKAVNEKVTPTNLMKAFAGESQARNKYNFFAGIARDEGLRQIADFFDEFAYNEHNHAKLEFAAHAKLTKGAEWGKTAENLLAAAAGENYEHTSMYPEFAQIAKEEGYDDIARLFTAIGKVEVEHEKRYKALEAKLREQGFFASEDEEAWVCDICGHIHYGKKAPGACTVCKATQGHFYQQGL